MRPCQFHSRLRLPGCPVSNSKIRVALVDDQPLFAAGLRMLIDAQPDMLSVAVATDGVGAVDIAASGVADVMLMDLRMPRLNGLRAIEQIVAEHGDRAPAIIVLTTIAKDEATFEALRAGAQNFLTKDAAPAVVITAIRQARLDVGVLRNAETRKLLDLYAVQTREAVPKLESRLTAREREVVHLVARGLANNEIAAAMGISEATTKTHVRSILTKLDLRNRVQIAILAFESGLIRVPTASHLSSGAESS